MESSGDLDIIARSHDGLIEAVRHPEAPHRVGVQWHPERTTEHRFGQGLFDALVKSIRTEAWEKSDLEDSPAGPENA